MTDYTQVVLERRDQVAVVRLHGESRRNAIGSQTIREFAAAFDEIEGDEGIRAVVLTGSGSAFCAGADVSGLGSGENAGDVHRTFRRDITFRIENCPVPVIAAINGPAYAGGMEIAISCDIRYAADSARFADTEIKIGLVGGIQRLRRLAPALAAEWLLTAAVIDTATALHHGIVSKVVPAGSVLDEAVATAEKIAGMPPLAVRGTKELLRNGPEMDLRTSDGYERELLVRLASTEDHREGIAAFLDKRPAVYQGR